MATAKKAEEKNTGLAIITQEDFAIASFADIKEVMEENLDSTFSEFDLPKITMASGGLTKLVRNTIAGEEVLDTVEVVIIAKKNVRVYYQDENALGTAPDCHSDDMVTGIGKRPGDINVCSHDCATCPMSQWDSGKDDVGKACKEKVVLAVLLPGEIIPSVISVPATSAKNFRVYTMQLTQSQMRFHQVVTEIGVAKSKSAGGKDYGKLTFTFKGVLADDQKQSVGATRSAFEPMFKKISARSVDPVETESETDTDTE